MKSSFITFRFVFVLFNMIWGEAFLIQSPCSHPKAYCFFSLHADEMYKLSFCEFTKPIYYTLLLFQQVQTVDNIDNLRKKLTILKRNNI